MAEKKKQVKGVVLAITAAVVCIIVYRIAGKLIGNVVMDDFLRSLLDEFVFAGAAFISVVLLRQTALFRSDRSCLKSGWTSAGLLIAMTLYYAVFMSTFKKCRCHDRGLENKGVSFKNIGITNSGM